MAAVLSAYFEQEPQQNNYPAQPSLPPTIMSLSRSEYRALDEGELHRVCMTEFGELSITAEESNFLFKITFMV